jgi:hypothetical protein
MTGAVGCETGRPVGANQPRRRFTATPNNPRRTAIQAAAGSCFAPAARRSILSRFLVQNRVVPWMPQSNAPRPVSFGDRARC